MTPTSFYSLLLISLFLLVQDVTCVTTFGVSQSAPLVSSSSSSEVANEETDIDSNSKTNLNCEADPQACAESSYWTYETQFELITFDLDLFGENDDEEEPPLFEHEKLKQLTEKYLLDAFKDDEATSPTIHRIELVEKKEKEDLKSKSVGNYEGIVYFRGVDNIPTTDEVENVQIKALENFEALNKVLSDYLSEILEDEEEE